MYFRDPKTVDKMNKCGGILKAILFFTLFLFSDSGIGQVVHYPESKPKIYTDYQKAGSIASIRMPKLNVTKLKKESSNSSEHPRPFTFGYLHEVKLNMENSGIWVSLESGKRVWRLKIYAPDAITINLNYSKFNIPKGGKFYVFNDTQKDVLGPFTYQNVKENRRFATGFTRGAYSFIEYHEPLNQRGKAVIEIDGVVHGYRSLNHIISETFKTLGESGPCNYDVRCELGNGWEDQIKSVAMVLTENNTGGCTGTLINTTANNCEPYLLTADHCFPNDNPGDSLNNFFMFNFETPDPQCPGTANVAGPIDQIVHGCTVVSKSADDGETVDFCLLRLATNPIDFYDVYYSGWDRRNTPVDSVVGIHHTVSDVKKISIDDDPIISSDDDVYWHVRWDQGTTEPGASGSAVFDAVHKRILGQLSGGFAECNGNESNEGEEDFGKIYYGWDMVGPDPVNQLKPWLDPINSGALFVDGLGCTNPLAADFLPSDVSEFIFCDDNIMRFEDRSLGLPSSWTWTFSGAGVNISSSNDQNPEIIVTNSGTLVVNLEVTNDFGTDMISQSYPISFIDCSEHQYCQTVNAIIPDDTLSVASTITLPSGTTLIDADIEVDITHTYIADIVVEIEHEGTKIRLLSRANHPIRDCFEENLIATFDDEATLFAQTMCNANSPAAISGLVIPFNSLSAFDNKDIGGDWIITVRDIANGDSGVLNAWCINTQTECYSELSHANGLLQIESGYVQYESSDWILTSEATTIKDGAKAYYDAGQFIQFNPTFEIERGAEFEAIIDGCNSSN